MINIRDGWSEVLNILEKELTAVSFDLWIKSLSPYDIVNDKLILIANSEAAKNQCLKNYYTSIKLAVNDIFSDSVSSFEIINENEKDKILNPTKIESEQIVNNQIKINLNPKYTFDNFVVGKSNQIVYAAARSVAENPSSKFNPLFIYGGVGLGKTHLLHAIGNYLKINKPSLRVMYVTCEQFANDYIDSIRSVNKDVSITKFREKYRNVDVLMVDDIQFISKKIETQENFFHTFNDLYQNNKQIVIASDRSPKEIETLSDRLLSRFQSGLIQDIQTPDFETRVAILKKKAQQENFNVDNAVIDYLADKIDTNIRELEGYLSKVVFYANLTGHHFASLEDAKNALQDQMLSEKQNISTDTIINAVCTYYNVKKDDLVGKKKNKEIVDPRQVAIYLITEFMDDMPLTSIGQIFGGRDHTTIIHSRDKITNSINENIRLKTTVNDIKSLILKH